MTDRQRNGRAKQRFVTLVGRLRGRRLKLADIAILLDRSPQRIGQVTTAYALDPPDFQTRDHCLAWLSSIDPELAAAVRDFQKENESSAPKRKRA